MMRERGVCWIIAEPGDPLARLLTQFAELRGARARFVADLSTFAATLPAAPGNLIGVDAGDFASWEPRQKRLLKFAVEHGTILYLRGFGAGRDYCLEPFAAGRFEIAVGRCDQGYRFTNDPIVPGALRGEGAQSQFELPGAEGLETVARPLLRTHSSGKQERASIFALPCGAGLVICDLLPVEPFANEPIIARLSQPSKRCANVGALLAMDITQGRDLELRAAFNLTIDDRPASHDYFSSGRLERLLRGFDAQWPGVHVDFAWTPDQTHPYQAYIDTLKAYNTGFVWHGFQHHVDHTKIDDPDRELAAGNSLVNHLSRRFGVHFQRVMIFPFERANARTFATLVDHEFLGAVEHANARPWLDDSLPPHLRYSTPAHYYGSAGLPCLRRYSPSMLTRDTMLALATLGYPIIVAGHPGDVMLRRFAPAPFTGSSRYFDDALAFAAEKHLRPASLEQLAGEVFASRSAETSRAWPRQPDQFFARAS